MLGIGYIDVGDKWILVSLSWCQFLDVSVENVGDKNGQNRHQHLKVVASTFLQQGRRSATSVTNIDVAT